MRVSDMNLVKGSERRTVESRRKDSFNIWRIIGRITNRAHYLDLQIRTELIQEGLLISQKTFVGIGEPLFVENIKS